MVRRWKRVLLALLVIALFLGVAKDLSRIHPPAVSEGIVSTRTESKLVQDILEHSRLSDEEGPPTERSNHQSDSRSDRKKHKPIRPPKPDPPAGKDLSKTIVMGALLSEDTSWVHTELSTWQSVIYIVDLPPNTTSPTGHRTPINKAREAMPYLTYIIDHYETLPDINVFLHAHRAGWPRAWHTEGPRHDIVRLLRKLRLPAVQQKGYANLRCSHEPGCPDEVQPFRLPLSERKEAESAFPHVYAEFFNAPFAQMEAEIGVVAAPCCAQFAVTRERIWRREKGEYERFRRVLERSRLGDDVLGRVMEYLWHIIFGMEIVFCPDERKCKCELYGQCWRGVMGKR